MSSMPLEKILVAIKPRGDGSAATLEHARYFAGKIEGALRLVSCVYDTVVSAGVASGESHSMSAEAAMIEAEQELLDALVAEIDNPECSIDAKARWGNPVEEVLIDEAAKWNAHLLVMGAETPSVRAEIGIRGLGMRLAPQSPCPVLLARRTPLASYERILAAIDPLHGHDEPYGLDGVVLDAALGFAVATGATVEAVHACPDPESFELASAVEVEPGVVFDTDNLSDAHRLSAIGLAASHGIDKQQVHIVTGDPTSVITDTARERDADLVVIGAVKRGVLAEAILGSTARRVAAELDCDVLLVSAPLSEQPEK